MQSHSVQRFGEPVEAVEQPDPEPVGSEVVIDVQRCGVCHTDLHLQDGFYELGGGKRAHLSDRGIEPPIVLGHEVLGTLTATGPDAPISDIHIGQSFLVYPWVGCGHCVECRRGVSNLCDSPNSIGVARPGGYAEKCIVPHPDYLVDVTGIDPTVAATYACSGLTAYSALSKVAEIDRENDVLLLVGLGGVGLSGLQIALALGYKKIAVADIDPDKRALGAEAGVTVLDPRHDDALEHLRAQGGVAAAVDFVGTTGTTEFALSTLRKGGICVVVGLFGGDVTFSLPPLVQRSITIRGSFVGTLDELKELIQLARKGNITPLPVETIDFDSANDALNRLRHGSVTGRLVLAR